jgi:hypothetical protein|nr:MAG TPA: helix-turn-helix domain protein [Caudoviricetes sp.]
MRYIDEINSFHDWLMTNPTLSASARILWFALMHYCNKTGWKREFNVAISALEMDTGLSRRSVIRARDELQQLGRIIIRQRKGNQSATYKIVSFACQTGTQCGTQSVTQSDTQDPKNEIACQTDTQFGTQCGTHPGTIPRLRQRHRQENILGSINTHSGESMREGEVVKNPTKASDKKFKPPTVEEVRAYCQERANGIDAEEFCDFYESKGWFVGKNKMKDWKACVRTWERNRKTRMGQRQERYPKTSNGKQQAISAVQNLMARYEQEAQEYDEEEDHDGD